jgi:hypothetical protein
MLIDSTCFWPRDRNLAGRVSPRMRASAGSFETLSTTSGEHLAIMAAQRRFSEGESVAWKPRPPSAT